jgi:Uma2 family endonuclease
MNVDEFLVWSEKRPDDRYELVDGEIVVMTRDTVAHNRTKRAAHAALRDAVRSGGLPCEGFIDLPGIAVCAATVLGS